MTGGPETAAEVGRDAVVAFLHLEARLLDLRRYRDWLGLLTADIRYVMAAVENRYARDGLAEGPPLSFFDDTMEDLERRVQRFELDSSWPEDPPTRHVHVISNIESFPGPDGVVVHSTFINYRSRGDHDEMLLFGRREDLLRIEAGGLRLARRTISSGQSLLHARNLNTFL